MVFISTTCIILLILYVAVNVMLMLECWTGGWEQLCSCCWTCRVTDEAAAQTVWRRVDRKLEKSQTHQTPLLQAPILWQLHHSHTSPPAHLWSFCVCVTTERVWKPRSTPGFNCMMWCELSHRFRANSHKCDKWRNVYRSIKFAHSPYVCLFLWFLSQVKKIYDYIQTASKTIQNLTFLPIFDLYLTFLQQFEQHTSDSGHVHMCS